MGYESRLFIVERNELERDNNTFTEQKQLDRELQCREMINSILVYHGKFNIMNDEYLKKYIKELGYKRVKELVDEQVEDFKKAIVLKNTSVDCEGVSYNSIIWADEQ